jgi:hypothetical protein
VPIIQILKTISSSPEQHNQKQYQQSTNKNKDLEEQNKKWSMPLQSLYFLNYFFYIGNQRLIILSIINVERTVSKLNYFLIRNFSFS